jgi:hypothetical protein
MTNCFIPSINQVDFLKWEILEAKTNQNGLRAELFAARL